VVCEKRGIAKYESERKERRAVRRDRLLVNSSNTEACGVASTPVKQERGDKELTLTEGTVVCSRQGEKNSRQESHKSVFLAPTRRGEKKTSGNRRGIIGIARREADYQKQGVLSE